MSSSRKPTWRYRRRRLDFTRVRLERSVEVDGQAVLITAAPALVPIEQLDGWQESDEAVVVLRLNLPRATAGRPWQLALTSLQQGATCDAV